MPAPTTTTLAVLPTLVEVSVSSIVVDGSQAEQPQGAGSPDIADIGATEDNRMRWSAGRQTPHRICGRLH
jgi:hypothetical protein